MKVLARLKRMAIALASGPRQVEIPKSGTLAEKYEAQVAWMRQERIGGTVFVPVGGTVRARGRRGSRPVKGKHAKPH